VTRTIDVAAAILIRPDGAVLLAQRPPGKVYPGYWEFPGGKLEPGEAPRHALERELAEELGIVVVSAEPFLEVSHAYPDRQVQLDVWAVAAYTGEPKPREGQPLRWVTVEELADTGLLAADRPIVAALRALAE
jgi:8-oxo-dGTP diphosphatase